MYEASITSASKLHFPRSELSRELHRRRGGQRMKWILKVCTPTKEIALKLEADLVSAKEAPDATLATRSEKENGPLKGVPSALLKTATNIEAKVAQAKVKKEVPKFTLIANLGCPGRATVPTSLSHTR